MTISDTDRCCEAACILLHLHGMPRQKIVDALTGVISNQAVLPNRFCVSWPLSCNRWIGLFWSGTVDGRYLPCWDSCEKSYGKFGGLLQTQLVSWMFTRHLKVYEQPRKSDKVTWAADKKPYKSQVINKCKDLKCSTCCHQTQKQARFQNIQSKLMCFCWCQPLQPQNNALVNVDERPDSCQGTYAFWVILVQSGDLFFPGV